jgi:excisionase family DNA binding protein
VEKLLVSVDEFAEAAGVSDWTVKRLLREGVVPSVKINGRRLVPVQAIRAYIDGLMEGQESGAEDSLSA